MPVGSIYATIVSLGHATNIAKAFMNLKTATEIQGKVIELQSAILAAQTDALAAQAEQSSMIDQIRSLKEELARVKAWEETKKRYELHSPYPGTFVYALKKESGTSEPSHWICTNCSEDSKRSILQLQERGGVYDKHGCPVCYATIVTKGTRKDLGFA